MMTILNINFITRTIVSLLKVFVVQVLGLILPLLGQFFFTPESYPWDKSYFQWDIIPTNPSDYNQGVILKSHYSNAHMRTGSVIDSNSVYVIHKGNLSDAYALWFLAVPLMSDSKPVACSYYNSSSLDFNFEFELSVGIESTQSQTVTQQITSEIGCQFKAFSASLSYSHTWETSSSQTFSVSQTNKFSVIVPPKKGIKILQLTGSYGCYNIKSNVWDTQDWDSSTASAGTLPVGQPVYIESAVGGVCVHLHGGEFNNGAPITSWQKVDAPNLKWIIQATGTGHYFLGASGNSKFVIHQSGASGENGAEISLWDKTGIENYQHLQVDIVPTGSYYYIKFVHSGKGIHLPGSSTENGTPLTQWDCVDQNNLKWKIYSA